MGKDLNGKKLGKGISQREDGRYNGRATINGVKINIYDFNLTLLKKRLEAEKAKVLRDEYNVRPSLTLDEWFKVDWFPTYKGPHLKGDINRHNYVTRYEHTFGRLLGNKKVAVITEIMVQKAANDLIDEYEYSTKFIREALSSLKECLNAAITNSIITRNPCVNVVVKNDHKVETRVVMTVEQQEQFMEIARNRYYCEVYQILLSTGMRIGELSALSWDDVDFDNKVVHVSKSMQCAYVKGTKHMEITYPKTQNGTRDIPMFEGVAELFQSWKEKQEAQKLVLGKRWRMPDELKNLVFTTSMGSPLTRYILASDINKIVSIINRNEIYLAGMEKREPKEFPKVHPHSFRHTFATRCFEKDLKPMFIMKVMGHSNYETTLSYTHLLKKSTDEQIELAGSFIA